jgi:hypothetical protein
MHLLKNVPLFLMENNLRMNKFIVLTFMVLIGLVACKAKPAEETNLSVDSTVLSDTSEAYKRLEELKASRESDPEKFLEANPVEADKQSAYWALKIVTDSDIYQKFKVESKGLTIMRAVGMGTDGKFTRMATARGNESTTGKPKWILGFQGENGMMLFRVYPDGTFNSAKYEGGGYPKTTIQGNYVNSTEAILKALSIAKNKSGELDVKLKMEGDWPVWTVEIIDKVANKQAFVKLNAITLGVMVNS